MIYKKDVFFYNLQNKYTKEALSFLWKKYKDKNVYTKDIQKKYKEVIFKNGADKEDFIKNSQVLKNDNWIIHYFKSSAMYFF